MIASFKHRGLKGLYDERTARRVAPEHVQKLRDIFAVLDRSQQSQDVDLPGFQLHSLRGKMKGHYAITVSGNWRVTFRFKRGEVVDVDYFDSH